MATRPSQDGRIQSHGRGGAGNLAKDDPTAKPKAEDLITPTLKSNTYTTGRGGTGNMAQNDPERPELARAAQDVDAPAQAADAKVPTHYGRGGAANIINKDAQRKSGEAKRKSEETKRKSEEAKRAEGAGKGGLLGKGKELLNKLKK